MPHRLANLVDWALERSAGQTLGLCGDGDSGRYSGGDGAKASDRREKGGARACGVGQVSYGACGGGKHPGADPSSL